jgi:hypothetical protein
MTMAEIEPVPRTVYFAPTRRRHFMTLHAAAHSEAASMLNRKYPPEAGDRSTGESGWDWRCDERLCRVHERLSRMIIRRFRNRSADNG